MGSVPPSPNSLTPFIPPINISFPVEMMNRTIDNYGVRLQRMRSSTCPCMFGGRVPGSPDANCQSCYGKGIIWDAPSSIFIGSITYERFGSEAPGASNNPKMGEIISAEPNLTIPSSQQAFAVWQDASTYDAYIEIDSTARFYSYLVVGDREVVPYQHSLTIAPTGAVAIWNTITRQREYVTNYTVDGPTVTISGYPQGTAYIVEYTASPTYVAYQSVGGFVHTRPLGTGLANYPKRFKVKLLDLWQRQSFSNQAL